MRTVDSAAIARHAAVRYWWSAKVTEWLAPPLGLVLDDGCDAGGMCVRKARHVSRAVARIVPSAVCLALPEIPLVRDVTVNSVEFLLMRLMCQQ